MIEIIIDKDFVGNTFEFQINEKRQMHGYCKLWLDDCRVQLWGEWKYIKGRQHGLYKDWWATRHMNFMQQKWNDDNHGVRIQFKY